MGRFIKRQNKKDLNVDTKHTLLRQYISNLFPFALNMNGLFYNLLIIYKSLLFCGISPIE